jgi:hypothetical protein
VPFLPAQTTAYRRVEILQARVRAFARESGYPPGCSACVGRVVLVGHQQHDPEGVGEVDRGLMPAPATA